MSIEPTERIRAGAGGVSVEAHISPRTVVGLIAVFAVTIIVATGAALGTAGICEMAGLPGPWQAGIGLGAFVVVGGIGLTLLICYKDRGLNGE